MKSDLDRLMQENNLEAIVILGDEAPNPYRDYLTNRSNARGSIFKKRGEAGVFVVTSGMEIGEAATSGMKVYTYHDFGFFELRKKYAGQSDQIMRELFCNILRQLEITGRVGFYGVADVGTTLIEFSIMRDCVPDLEVAAGGAAAGLFDTAYLTKDDQEIAELKQAGALTSQIVRATWDFICQHCAEGDQVVDKNGKPLTIGAVKRFIRQRELDLDLQDPHDCIFAQGRDSAIPHSKGADEEILQVGKTLVFDIFPRRNKSGYYHDMTRTWCIGHAPVEVQAIYDDVMHVLRETSAAFKVGEVTSKYQIMALDYFESKGHPTARSKPGTLDGYVHGLGHGIGLNIHEAPNFGQFSSDVLQPRNVFTVEPGLYYPDRGYGVRVEDSVYFDANGVLHNLTDAPYDLVLPLKG